MEPKLILGANMPSSPGDLSANSQSTEPATRTGNGPKASRSTAASREYLSEAEFCDRYLVRPRTAQRWRTTGEGPNFVRLGPRRVAYRLTDCEAWAAARTFQHRADELAQNIASSSPSRDGSVTGKPTGAPCPSSPKSGEDADAA